MKTILKREYDVGKEIEELVTEASFKNFLGSVEYLEKIFESGESLKVTTAQIDVCRYALLLKGLPR